VKLHHKASVVVVKKVAHTIYGVIHDPSGFCASNKSGSVQRFPNISFDRDLERWSAKGR